MQCRSLQLTYARNVLCLILLDVFLCGACLAETTLYVSPGGNDASPGTKEKPLASIAGAQMAIRQLKGTGQLKQPVTVHISPGRYLICKTIELTPQDSGTQAAPITYEGAGPAKTVISGGIAIQGWKKGEGDLWQARIAPVQKGELYFRLLHVNGKRAQRAITPNRFYLRTAGPIKPLGDRDKARRDKSKKIGFRFREGDLKQWPDLDDVMVTAYHSWTASLHWIDELDLKKRIVTFTNNSGWCMGWWEKYQRYQIENYFEALDVPGEWYLNRKTGVLTYWPRPGEDMTTAQAIAPVVTELLRFNGDPDNGEFIEHVTFRGMSFQHADWEFDKTKPVDGQAHCSAKCSAVKAFGLRHSAIERCEIAHGGSHGIWMEKGCQDNRIAHCHIHDLGGGGVYVGEAGKVGYMPPTEAVKVHRNTIDNNFIHDICHLLGGSIGIWVGSSSLNTLSHNEISDFDYTGISVGWCWGRSKNIFQHSNIIEHNHVHHNGDDILSDNGGIYVLGYSPDSVIRNNLVHDIYHYPYVNGSRGIYLDGNTSSYLVENNICYNIGSEGIVVKGEHNVVRNNIFAFCGECGLYRLFKARAKSFDYDQDKIHRNIVLQRIDVMTKGYYHTKWTDIDYNLYWSTESKGNVVFDDYSSRILKDAPKVDRMPFAEWQALGRDVHSIAADPRFVDAEKHDFRLREDSPAEKIGFKEIDMSRVGLYGDKAWTDLPKTITREPLVFAPPQPKERIDYDFETSDPGDLPMVAGRISISGEASIRVTDKAAAGGTRGLMFVDGPSPRAWQPHWYIRLKPKPGRVKLSCDLMIDSALPATFTFEFRDYATKPFTGKRWHGGPTVMVLPDGAVKTGEKAVAQVPLGEWMHMEIEFEHGEGRPKTYRLKVGKLGGEMKAVDELPFVSDAFTSCTWFGISALDKKKAVFYIDNFRIDFDE